MRRAVEGFNRLDEDGKPEWVVPCPAGEVTLEAVCHQILGQADWRTTETLTVSQVMECVGMLVGGWPHEMVAQAKDVLQRWGYFMQVFGETPPWEIEDSHWDALLDAAPWNPSGQGDLFGC